jgi:hypothetical protein|tara:strand:- start:151 stop:396 length:246 start_codon:yes stop_codon:yes gene_type:complete
MLLAEGYENAFIGITIPQSSRDELAVYDFAICIDIIMKRENIKEEDAVDYFYFNVVNSFAGNYTPLFIKRATFEQASKTHG